MASTAIRRSMAEPEHFLFGVPIISYGAFAVFPLGAMISVIGFKPGLAIGTALAVLIHTISVIIRIRQPFAQRLIAYWFINAVSRGLVDVIKGRRRVYLR